MFLLKKIWIIYLGSFCTLKWFTLPQFESDCIWRMKKNESCLFITSEQSLLPQVVEKKKTDKELNITSIDVQQTTKRLFSLLAEKYISPFIPLIIKYAFFFLKVFSKNFIL